MKLKLSSVLLLLVAVLFFSSCEKELSFENGGVPGLDAADFTLGGSPSDCTGFVATGTYMAGIALTASNTVSVEVDVTTEGTYSLSTATVNGIKFSTSGSFTSTGIQTITMTGTGTPVAGGDFTYSVTNSNGNCSFVITVAPAGPAAVGTLDCTGATNAGTYTQSVALGSGNTVTIPVNVTTAGSYSVTSTTMNGVTFSGAGALATGAQTIVLTGSGIPTNSGTVSFPVNFGASNCSFSIDFAPGTTSATDFIHCKIDGVDKTFDVGVLALDIFGMITINGSESSAANAGNFSFVLSNLSTMTVAPGTYPINNLMGNNSVPAYIPDVSSPSATSWSGATAGQSGTFAVVVTVNSTTRVEGTFSGTLYDNDGAGSNTKIVAGGTFSVPK